MASCASTVSAATSTKLAHLLALAARVPMAAALSAELPAIGLSVMSSTVSPRSSNASLPALCSLLASYSDAPPWKRALVESRFTQRALLSAMIAPLPHTAAEWIALTISRIETADSALLTGNEQASWIFSVACDEDQQAGQTSPLSKAQRDEIQRFAEQLRKRERERLDGSSRAIEQVQDLRRLDIQAALLRLQDLESTARLALDDVSVTGINAAWATLRCSFDAVLAAQRREQLLAMETVQRLDVAELAAASAAELMHAMLTWTREHAQSPATAVAVPTTDSLPVAVATVSRGCDAASQTSDEGSSAEAERVSAQASAAHLSQRNVALELEAASNRSALSTAFDDFVERMSIVWKAAGNHSELRFAAASAYTAEHIRQREALKTMEAEARRICTEDAFVQVGHIAVAATRAEAALREAVQTRRLKDDQDHRDLLRERCWRHIAELSSAAVDAAKDTAMTYHESARLSVSAASNLASEATQRTAIHGKEATVHRSMVSSRLVDLRQSASITFLSRAMEMFAQTTRGMTVTFADSCSALMLTRVTSNDAATQVNLDAATMAQHRQMHVDMLSRWLEAASGDLEISHQEAVHRLWRSTQRAAVQNFEKEKNDAEDARQRRVVTSVEHDWPLPPEVTAALIEARSTRSWPQLVSRVDESGDIGSDPAEREHVDAVLAAVSEASLISQHPARARNARDRKNEKFLLTSSADTAAMSVAEYDAARDPHLNSFFRRKFLYHRAAVNNSGRAVFPPKLAW
jgi:hypothetical protein